jgi:hypothetical protein
VVSRHALAASAPRTFWGLFIFACAGLSAAVVPAQEQQPRPTSAADTAFAAADIPRAESLYYMAVRMQPRDPVAREALGGYLAMRGASRIAAVLLEEARMFGGDPARIATQLTPLYESLGDWRALLSLPGAALTLPRRRRVAWLAEHPPTIRADSTSLALTGTVRGDTMGRITIRIAGRPVVAIIVARDVGVTVGPRVAGTAATHFAGDSMTIVLDSINIGAARLAMVPATVDPSVGVAIIGIGVLSPMTMAFDYDKKRVYFNQLRGVGRAYTLPFFRDRGEFRVAEKAPVRWSSLASVIGAAHTGHEVGPVTIDLKAGEIRIAY